MGHDPQRDHGMEILRVLVCMHTRGRGSTLLGHGNACPVVCTAHHYHQHHHQLHQGYRWREWMSREDFGMPSVWGDPWMTPEYRPSLVLSPVHRTGTEYGSGALVVRNTRPHVVQASGIVHQAPTLPTNCIRCRWMCVGT